MWEERLTQGRIDWREESVRVREGRRDEEKKGTARKEIKAGEGNL